MKAQNIFLTLFFLFLNIQSIAYASQKHSGICEFMVAKDDRDDAYIPVGTTFMTKKIDEIWETRGNLDLNERFMVAPRHLEMNEWEIRKKVFSKDFNRDSSNVYKAIKNETFKYFKARCGNIEFKIERIDMASKPLRQNLIRTENVPQSQIVAECERNEESIRKHASETRLLKRGCDLTVYKIVKSTILIKDSKTGSTTNQGNERVLDDIIGFEPRVRLSTVNELRNIFFKNSNGKLFKCNIIQSLSSSLIADCKGNSYTAADNSNFNSGSLIYAENPQTGQILKLSENNTPVLGFLTRRQCSAKREMCLVDIDLLQVSYDLDQNIPRTETGSDP